MTNCQACHRPNDLYLCQNCQTQLANMLDQLPWLLDELDNRIARLDRITAGTIGRNRRPDEMNPIDFDAIELARTIRKKLLHWVETIATRAAGRPPNALTTVATADLARWLNHNISHIARLDLATKGRHPLYDDITRMVGTSDQRTGTLVRAINPEERHLVGPCPTITGRNPDGTPRQCQTNLFADTYDQTVDCPHCQQTVNVETTRLQAAADRDLHTRNSLLDVLNAIDEPINPNQLDRWIKYRRLQRKGWLQDGTATEYQLTERAEPLYSVDQARKLRRRDQRITHRTAAATQK
jgi:uncharacterized Zn finger protein (UPF0148 family)